MRVRHVVLAAILSVGLGQIATAAPVVPAAAAIGRDLASGPELVRWHRHWHHRHWRRHWHHRRWHRRHWHRRHHGWYGRRHGYGTYASQAHRGRRGGWIDPRGGY